MAFLECNGWELLDGNLSACSESVFDMLKLIVYLIIFVMVFPTCILFMTQ